MMCSRLVSTKRPIATLFISRMVSRITAKASRFAIDTPRGLIRSGVRLLAANNVNADPVSED
jgi:hypothetical protein